MDKTTLNALVAEKVMNRCVHKLEYQPSAYMQDPQRKGPYDWTLYECAKCHQRFMDDFTPYVPNYIGDIAEAWTVLEKMKQDGNNVWISWSGTIWEVGSTVLFPNVTADTAPLAICLAALKAVGVTVED